MENILHVVAKEDRGKNLEWILKNRLGISRTMLRRIKHNRLFVNGQKAFTNLEVIEGDVIEITMDKEDTSVKATKMPIDVLYEDDYILAVNKPGNILVHPIVTEDNNTLANGVMYYLLGKGHLQNKIRIINRLDRETSGVVLIAKSQVVQHSLSTIELEKSYIAILEGMVAKDEDFINLPIRRKAGSIIEREIGEGGQSALTKYRVLKRYNKFTLVSLRIYTGRTHQIRVHMAYIGHPIVGDTLYGKESDLIERQALHCNKISYTYPLTNKEVAIESSLPEDMVRAIRGM